MQCPICKKPVESPADPNAKTPYPFCSERCRLIDLGRWLGGKYQIPVRPDDDDSETTPRQTLDSEPD
ncbi:MAG TPA: DNA gyrase inhibitor YacG [Tepidisphaeraceae bacterium]|jgi:hypothetical protein|nr:DNA gyrase inhibitor YacG [Tepidisphaeraceae bacterium]